jgi:hypothetical protein
MITQANCNLCQIPLPLEGTGSVTSYENNDITLLVKVSIKNKKDIHICKNCLSRLTYKLIQTRVE